MKKTLMLGNRERHLKIGFVNKMKMVVVIQ
jgi:hypothetical protein